MTAELDRTAAMGTALDPGTSAFQASLDIRVSLSRLRRRLRELATSDDLTAAQASVLTRLGKGEAHTASALADLEGVRPQSMATTIAALEQLGLVVRTPDPDDGRRQIVTLTPAGHDADNGNRGARQEWLTRTIETELTEDERQTLIAASALLERLARA
jgi:DNA-binding MarR family transcriptional regulator